MYVLRDVMLKSLLSVYQGKFHNNQWLVGSPETLAKTQVWKIEDPNAETTISDPTGSWCLTRFESGKGGKALQLDSST